MLEMNQVVAAIFFLLLLLCTLLQSANVFKTGFMVLQRPGLEYIKVCCCLFFATLFVPETTVSSSIRFTMRSYIYLLSRPQRN